MDEAGKLFEHRASVVVSQQLHLAITAELLHVTSAQLVASAGMLSVCQAREPNLRSTSRKLPVPSAR